MGVIMMTGIVVSNSILIVEFSGILHARGMTLHEAVVEACKVRLRPILMTSLATLLGMIPMALGIEAGSEQYAPLARAIIGGLAVSVVTTVFLVPAVYMIVHAKKETGVAGGRIVSHRIRLLLLGAVCFCAPILTRQVRAQMPEPRPEAMTPDSSNSSSQGAKPLRASKPKPSP